MSSSQRPTNNSIGELLARFRVKQGLSLKPETGKVTKELQTKIESLEKGLVQLKKHQAKGIAHSQCEFMTPRKRVKGSEYGLDSNKISTAVSTLRHKSINSNVMNNPNKAQFNRPLTSSKFEPRKLSSVTSSSIRRTLPEACAITSSKKPLIPIKSVSDTKKFLFF